MHNPINETKLHYIASTIVWLARALFDVLFFITVLSLALCTNNPYLNSNLFLHLCNLM